MKAYDSKFILVVLSKLLYKVIYPVLAIFVSVLLFLLLLGLAKT